MANNTIEIPYFYDNQVRRYLQQFIRLFSGLQVVIRHDSEGNEIYRTVPVRYGDAKRMVAHIIKNNSENTISTTPFISCSISQLQIDPVNRTYPQFEDKVPVIEKKFDAASNQYDNEQGNIYTLTRHQPVPYALGMQVDIWTSNTEQKLQILEQILVLFNPSLNIHTHNNPLDWSTLSVVELKNVIWTNRSMMQGVDDIIDISTLSFEMPILINPPAQVKRNSMIHTILTNLYTVPTASADTIETLDDLIAVGPDFAGYTITTLENYKMQFSIDDNGSATAKILNRLGGTTDNNGLPLSWKEVLKSYGELKPNYSQIRLKQTSNPGEYLTDIVGFIYYNDNDDSLLDVTLLEDTVPEDTQDPVNMIIDPQTDYPGDGTLPAAASGQRYLLINDVADGTVWGGLNASANDIVEHNGVLWTVTFVANNNQSSEHYTTNNASGDKLKWTGSQWVNAFEGTYNAGFWRLYL